MWRELKAQPPGGRCAPGMPGHPWGKRAQQGRWREWPAVDVLLTDSWNPVWPGDLLSQGFQRFLTVVRVLMLMQFLLVLKAWPVRGQLLCFGFGSVAEIDPSEFRGAPLGHPHAGSELPRVPCTHGCPALLQKHAVGGKPSVREKTWNFRYVNLCF